MDYDTRIIEWIKEGLKRPSKSVSDLATYAGIERNMIYKIMSGVRKVRGRELPLIAEYLEIPIPERKKDNFKIKIQSESPLQPQIAERMGGVSFGPDTVPILGHANGSSDAIMLNPENEIGRALRHPNQQGLNNAFALYAAGESMSPRYMEGELVYVVAGLPLIKGRDCIVEMKNGEAFLKQYFKTTDTHIICKQLNPGVEWKKLISDVKIIHIVVGRG